MCNVKIETEVANKAGRDEYLVTQLCLGFVMCVCWSVAVHLIKALGQRKSEEIDDRLDSSADNYIFLQNLPVGAFYEEELLEFVDELWDGIGEKSSSSLKIRSVQIIYNMGRVRQTIGEVYRLAGEICDCFDGEAT